MMGNHRCCRGSVSSPADVRQHVTVFRRDDYYEVSISHSPYIFYSLYCLYGFYRSYSLYSHYSFYHFLWV